MSLRVVLPCFLGPGNTARPQPSWWFKPGCSAGSYWRESLPIRRPASFRLSLIGLPQPAVGSNKKVQRPGGSENFTASSDQTQRQPESIKARMAGITFDPDGDLTLVVGQDPSKADFAVCSRTLSRASLVFKRMFNGAFLESKPTDGSPWIVSLPEDNPMAAKVLLAIVHSRFDLLLDADVSTPGTRGLYYILVFSEKYDLTKFIRPWAQSWVPSVEEFSRSADYHVLIGIAWELGTRTALEHVAKRMIVECGFNPEHGQLTGPDNKLLEYRDLPLMPHGLLDAIADARQQILDTSFTGIQADMKVLRAAVMCDTPNSEFNKGMCRILDEGSLLCNTLVLGTYMAGFRPAELRSISASGSNVEVVYPWSINHLIDMISESRSDITISGHEDCQRVASARADLIKGGLGPKSCLMEVLSKEHKEYLKKQKGKLGVLKAN